MVLFCTVHSWGDHVRPLSIQERHILVGKGRSSKPGPSCWKRAFLSAFPTWCQNAYWQLIDTQRACAIVASPNKQAEQINLPKLQGGSRPLTMWKSVLRPLKTPLRGGMCWYVQRSPQGLSTVLPT